MIRNAGIRGKWREGKRKKDEEIEEEEYMDVPISVLLNTIGKRVLFTRDKST